MQKSVILITTGIESGARSPQRTASVLYHSALSQVGLTGVLYTGGEPAFLAQTFDGLLLSGGGQISPLRSTGAPAIYRQTLSHTCRDMEDLL